MASPTALLLAASLMYLLLVTCREVRGQGSEVPQGEGRTLFLYLDDASRMVEVLLNSDGNLMDCAVYGDKLVIVQLLKKAPEQERKLVSHEELASLIASCEAVHKDLPESNLRRKRALQLIFPGTKWCGAGNIADSYDDLGHHEAADACCRQHDHCNITISALQFKYDLFNSGLYTRSHCNCETSFFNCLKSSNSSVGDSIGSLYFNVLAPRCLKEDHPTKCLQKGWWFTCRMTGKDTSRLVMTFADSGLKY